MFRVSWQGGEEFAWSESEALGLIDRNHLRLADEEGEVEGSNGESRPSATLRELHENRELHRLFEELSVLGLDIDTWALVREEAVTGEKMPARYAWISQARTSEGEGDGEGGARERIVEAANLQEILTSLLEIGRRGMEIKRFKGLGEMDAEQLWETTMDPSRRTLLRVTLDQAVEAEWLFTTLMGQQVEPRRRFIEDHALEVKNLDV
jgi:DNA gyrase subunit B